MLKIWTYNLTTFEIKEEEVDYVKDGRAIRKRKPNSKENTASWTNFTFIEENAISRVSDFIKAEIEVRMERVRKLQEALNKLNS